MSGQREVVARFLWAEGGAPGDAAMRPVPEYYLGHADDLLAHLAAAPVAADRDALAALVETAVRRRVDDWFASSAEVYTSGNAESWRRGLVGYVTRGPGSVTDALAPHIAAVVAAAREAALAPVRAMLDEMVDSNTERGTMPGVRMQVRKHWAERLRAALADAGNAAPPADEGYVCEVCGCWNPTGAPCKYEAEHVEVTW